MYMYVHVYKFRMKYMCMYIYIHVHVCTCVVELYKHTSFCLTLSQASDCAIKSRTMCMYSGSNCTFVLLYCKSRN